MKRPESRVIPTLDDLVFPGNNSIEPEKNEPSLSPDLKTRDTSLEPSLLDTPLKTGSPNRGRLMQEPQFPPLKTNETSPYQEPACSPITQLTSRAHDHDHNVPFLTDSSPSIPSQEKKPEHAIEPESAKLEAYSPSTRNHSNLDTEKSNPDQAFLLSNRPGHSSTFKPDAFHKPDRPAINQNTSVSPSSSDSDDIRPDTPSSSRVSLTSGHAGNLNMQELEKLILKALDEVLEIEIPLLQQRLVKAILKEIRQNQ